MCREEGKNFKNEPRSWWATATTGNQAERLQIRVRVPTKPSPRPPTPAYTDGLRPDSSPSGGSAHDQPPTAPQLDIKIMALAN